MKNKIQRKILKHSRCVLLGVSIYFFISTLFVTLYKFDNSLSLCACKPTTYRPSSFILKTLLYKEKVYAINTFGCGGVNSCLPNSFIFPIDLLTLALAFLVLFFILGEEKKRIQRKKTRQTKKEMKTEQKGKKKTAVASKKKKATAKRKTNKKRR